jgi:L-fuconolactonase
MKIDAHQHFWIYNQAEYGWIPDEMDDLRRDFLPAELAALQAPLGFDGSVAVQARQTLEETAWLLSLADQHPHILGVVGWVDLTASDVTAQLERFSARPRLRGIRHVLQSEPDGSFMLREDFRRGVGQLARFGLAYDLLIYPRHLPAAGELVSRFPGQAFVLDHIAKPPIARGELQPWADDLRRVAAFQNVSCKLSGMVTEADWQNWKPADFLPYLDAVLEAFGPGRLLIGSDWPVCTAAGTYGQVMDIVLGYIRKLSPEEQAGILGENARRIYNIPSQAIQDGED